MDDPYKLASLIAVGLALFSFGCGGQARPPSAEEDGGRGGILVSDAGSLQRAELGKADREFARGVRDTGLEAWVDGFAEGGMVLPVDGPVAKGPTAIRELFAPLFADPGFEITWAPTGTEVASSGDFGYTFGDWRTSMPTAGGEGGEVSQSEGKYVTVWQRDQDGRWRVLVDIGNSRQVPVQVD